MISCHCSFSKSPSRAVCSPVTATQVLANQSGRVDWVATTPSRVSASSGVGTYRPATISFYVRSLLIPEVASSMMRAALRWSDPPSVSSRGASDARLCLGGWGGGRSNFGFTPTILTDVLCRFIVSFGANCFRWCDVSYWQLRYMSCKCNSLSRSRVPE